MAGGRQERARPWDRWAGVPVPGRAVGVPAVSAALVLVLVAVAVNLGRPQGGEQGPSGTPTGPISTWLLSLDQLEQVLDRIDAGGGADVAKVIVANVAITQNLPPGVHPAGSSPLHAYCIADGVPGSTCSFAYHIDGSDPPISVVGVPDTVPCGTGRCDIAVTPGPFALGLHAGRVLQYVSPVRLRGDAAVPWSVDDFIDSTSTEPMVVDGWLSGIPPLPCPLDPRPSTGFECGPASWVTASPFDASATPAPSSDGAYSFAAPARGIRAQNAASSIVGSSTGLAGDAPSVPGPRRGLFLLNRVDVDPATCFLCSSSTAFMAAEVEPIEVGAPMASPPPSLGPSPTPTPADQASGWRMDESALAGAVREASEIGGAGRVVIADVSFERAGDCAEPIDLAQCYVVVMGSNPAIRVRNTVGLCPGTFYCPIEISPVIPAAGPFALEILGDGSVSFVGYVGTPNGIHSGSDPTWTVDSMRSDLAGMSGALLSDYRLFVVTGWISAAAATPKCLYIGNDGRFGCGQAAWLTGGPAKPNAYPSDGWSLTTPPDSIRLQNGAVPQETIAHIVTGDEQAVFGTFLVRAVLPAPTCIFCDGPVAELVAWLDPAKGLVTADSEPKASDLPSPGASLSAEAAYAKAYAVKFEQSRATGDWAEAWLLLGPKSKAGFGSLQSFEDAEAAYNATGATTYEIADPVQDPAFLSQSYLGDFWSDIDISTAWYVGVNHPEVAGASAAFEGLVVGSGDQAQQDRLTGVVDDAAIDGDLDRLGEGLGRPALERRGADRPARIERIRDLRAGPRRREVVLPAFEALGIDERARGLDPGLAHPHAEPVGTSARHMGRDRPDRPVLAAALERRREGKLVLGHRPNRAREELLVARPVAVERHDAHRRRPSSRITSR